AYNNLGVTLSRLGDYKAARDAFDVSLKIQPSNDKIAAKLKEVTAKLGESKHFDYNATAVAPASVQPTNADGSSGVNPTPTAETVAKPVGPAAGTETVAKPAGTAAVAKPAGTETVAKPAGTAAASAPH